MSTIINQNNTSFTSLQSLKNLLKKSSVKTIGGYTFSSVLLNISTLIVGILVLRWIDPEKMGLWSSVLLFQPYIQFLNLGIHVGFGRELPFYLGKNDTSKSQKIINTGYFVSVVAAIVGLVLMLIYSLILVLNNGFHYLPTGIVVTFIVFITFLQLFLTSLYRSNSDFKKLSLIYIYESIAIMTGIPLVYLYGFPGFLAYQAFFRVVLLALTIYFKPFTYSFRFHKAEFIELVSIGGPLYIFGYINGLIKTIPRVFILLTGGVFILGLFAPINTISNSLHTISKYFAQYFMPKMAFNYGADEKSKEMFWAYTIKSSIVIFFLNLTVFIPSLYLIDIFVPLILPKYTLSIVAMKIVLLSGLLSGSSVGVTALNVLKDYKGRLILTLSNLIVVLSSLAICYTIIDDLLIAMAVGIVIGDFVQNLINLFYVKRKVTK